MCSKPEAIALALATLTCQQVIELLLHWRAQRNAILDAGVVSSLVLCPVDNSRFASGVLRRPRSGRCRCMYIGCDGYCTTPCPACRTAPRQPWLLPISWLLRHGMQPLDEGTHVCSTAVHALTAGTLASIHARNRPGAR